MTGEKYTFIYESEGRRVAMEFTPDGDTHVAVTTMYIDFLRSLGYTIPYIYDPNICDLALSDSD